MHIQLLLDHFITDYMYSGVPCDSYEIQPQAIVELYVSPISFKRLGWQDHSY